jgi:hypothetical protein
MIHANQPGRTPFKAISQSHIGVFFHKMARKRVLWTAAAIMAVALPVNASYAYTIKETPAVQMASIQKIDIMASAPKKKRRSMWERQYDRAGRQIESAQRSRARTHQQIKWVSDNIGAVLGVGAAIFVFSVIGSIIGGATGGSVKGGSKDSSQSKYSGYEPEMSRREMQNRLDNSTS